MPQIVSTWLYPVQTALQRATLALLAGLAAAALLWTLAAALGLAPWLGLEIRLGGAPVEAGRAIQLALTALLAGLCFFLPTNARVLQLENSHRSFQATMWDVAHAYQLAHAADRDGVFTLRSEFDSVRERLQHLRRHPDLARLEPEILELAAQMSHESRGLAETYSTENVERARAFLRQRQEEADAMQAHIEAGRAACGELRRWHSSLAVEEDLVRARLAGLREELEALLPALGLELRDSRPTDVVPFRSFAGE